MQRTHNPLGVHEAFFREVTEPSKRKQQIAVKYFEAYMNVMAARREAWYLDLFAGPGIYEGDGWKSTPIQICERVVRNDLYRQNVKLCFNEGDPELRAQLKRNVAAVPGIRTLKFYPSFPEYVVTPALAGRFAAKMQRTFVFADPCGYKGLSLRLLAAALKGYGNDCLFFFNYSRVNMKISYEVMNDSINEFFEVERAEKLRSQVSGVRRKREREQLILTAVKSALVEAGAKAALAFTFKTGEFGRTSHHLVFASKNMRALQMMKNVMGGASSQIAEGVGSLDFTPGPRTLSLFSGLDEVANRLADEYAGRTITFQELTDLEVSQPYTIANYRDAVLRLEAEGFVEADPRSDLRPFQAKGEKKTLPFSTNLTFKARQ